MPARSSWLISQRMLPARRRTRKSKADLAAREAELPKLQQAVTDAKNASFAADAELQNARHAVDQASAAMDLVNSQINAQIQLKSQLEQLKAQVQSRADDVRTSIEPVAVADNDIRRQLGQDNRVLYGGISSASILLLAGVLIMMQIHAANQELPLNAMDPADDAVDPFWQDAKAEAKVHPQTKPVEPFPGANEVPVMSGEIVDEDETAGDETAGDEDAVEETSAL